MRLRVVDDELFLEHASPPEHPERPARIGAARSGLADCRFAADASLAPGRAATLSELLTVHSQAHLDRILATAGQSGRLDEDTFYSPRSVDAALRAAGGCVSLAAGLMAREFEFGLCLSRPPGHHATREQAMGFCLVNHIAAAAAHALTQGSERVLILDFDVHHGNGTEDIFYAEPRVLYASVHESPQYPGTGLATDCGAAAGRGYTVNVPLSAGAGDAAYVECFRRLFCPIIQQFRPDLLLVSAGYDAHERDPLGGMQVSNAGYAEFTRLMLEAMPEGGHGRTLFLLEGGYDLAGIRGGLSATLNALQAAEPSPLTGVQAQVEVSAAHRQQLDAAVRVHSEYWDVC